MSGFSSTPWVEDSTQPCSVSAQRAWGCTKSRGFTPEFSAMNSVPTAFCEVFITKPEEEHLPSLRRPRTSPVIPHADHLQACVLKAGPEGEQKASHGSEGTQFFPDLTSATACSWPLAFSYSGFISPEVQRRWWSVNRQVIPLSRLRWYQINCQEPATLTSCPSPTTLALSSGANTNPWCSRSTQNPTAPLQAGHTHPLSFSPCLASLTSAAPRSIFSAHGLITDLTPSGEHHGVNILKAETLRANTPGLWPLCAIFGLWNLGQVILIFGTVPHLYNDDGRGFHPMQAVGTQADIARHSLAQYQARGKGAQLVMLANVVAHSEHKCWISFIYVILFNAHNYSMTT